LRHNGALVAPGIADVGGPHHEAPRTETLANTSKHAQARSGAMLLI
jgi:hypothetical protein